MEAALYFIQSLDTGSVYVGVTRNARRRWARHRTDSRKLHTWLYRSMRKYGVHRHVFSIIEEYATFNEALEAEQWWIAYLRSLGARVFNLTAGGLGRLNLAHSPEVRARLAEMNRQRMADPEMRARISALHRGRRHCPEHRRRLSEAAKRRFENPEEREHLAAMNRGKRATPEARAKMSASHKGREFSPEHRRKLAEATAKRMADPKMKEFMSALHKGKVCSPETRAKLSAARRGKTANLSPEQRQRRAERFREMNRLRWSQPGAREALAESNRQRAKQRKEAE